MFLDHNLCLIYIYIFDGHITSAPSRTQGSSLNKKAVAARSPGFRVVREGWYLRHLIHVLFGGEKRHIFG